MHIHVTRAVSTITIAAFLAFASVANAEENADTNQRRTNVEQPQGSGAALFPEWSASLKALIQELFSQER